MSRFDYAQVAKHTLFALVVGVVGATASVTLCLCVAWSYGLFSSAHWMLWLLPAFGAISIFLYKWFKLPQNMTTHQVIILMREDKPISPLLAPGILLGTCLTMLGGGSVGKEAGALHMGASLGALTARPFHIKSVYTKNKDEKMDGYVSAVGMAATFSALFFAPLGSAMFVIELSNYKRSIAKHAFSIVLACFVAWAIASFVGIGDIIDKVAVPEISWPIVGHCIIIGVLAALGGTVFASALHWVHDLTERISVHYFIWTIVGGIIFALLVHFLGLFEFTGSGGNMMNDVLRGSYEPWDFAVKMLLTLICLGFWFRGGEIMPSFCIGALLGASCSYLSGGSVEFGAAVGAMAFFAAFTRCPIAAFLMGCEIFGWTTAPFLLIAILVSYMFGSPVGMFGAGVDKVIRETTRKKIHAKREQLHADIENELHK